jgi:hypothetical protein
MMQRITALSMALALTVASAGSAFAGAGEVLNSRRLYAVLGLGVTVLTLKEANEARKDANDFYDLYKTAGTNQRARELYDESRRLDTRSAMLLALGAGTLGLSAHLFFSGDDKRASGDDKSLMEVKGVEVEVRADLMNRRLQVGLSRDF